MQQREDGRYLLSPTDLVNFLGCAYSIVLDVRAFSQRLKQDEVTESEKLLRRKGQEHEATYLQLLKSEGKRVAEIGTEEMSIADRSRLTKEAMRKGADVIYQAALLDGSWIGYADFLLRTNTPSLLVQVSQILTGFAG